MIPIHYHMCHPAKKGIVSSDGLSGWGSNQTHVWVEDDLELLADFTLFLCHLRRIVGIGFTIWSKSSFNIIGKCY